MSSEHHLADAQRRAEEALARVLANAAAIIRLSWSDGATAADCRNLERIKSAAADIAQDHKILRALLASEPAKGEAAEPTGTRSTIDTHGVAYAPSAPAAQEKGENNG